MKRWIVPVLAAALLLAASPAPFKVRQALDRAVMGEREAIARYEAFAKKAEEEGYLGVASLFRAAARGEGVHLRRFVEAMQARGLNPPGEVEHHPVVGSTADNLRNASAAEAAERDGTYREAILAAEESEDDALRKVFDQTRDTEVEHANLFNTAARQLASMKEQRTYYVCDHCGYTTDVDLPLCALCRDRDHPHAVK
ncbi:MAG TPA: rubrerythrin family protein [Thermoanaerobaculia bacterium]|nr:rubrerythrin family protein [Thermoanaerobaculia bacterium]